jgi:hypothetical protein
MISSKVKACRVCLIDSKDSALLDLGNAYLMSNVEECSPASNCCELACNICIQIARMKNAVFSAMHRGLRHHVLLGDVIYVVIAPFDKSCVHRDLP